MPGPKNTELGIRSPLRLRGGIDFPNFEGISRQNDPGAIRSTQFFTLINVRLNGNEVQNRGGMDKVSDTQMTGCVYGFIDVPIGATSIFLVGNSIVGDDTARLDRYYSEATPAYSTAISAATTLQPLPTTNAQFADNTYPRRSLTRYNGGLYQFGLKAPASPALFRIVLPERTTTLTGSTDFLNQTKLAVTLDLPEFSSAVERQERFSDTLLLPVLYVGSVSTGNVYRYDGVSLTTEDSNLASKRHIMTLYQEDVYAISENLMTKRGVAGDWATSIALGTTKTWNAAQEYLSKLYIVGQATLLSWDGSSIVDLSATLAAACTDTPVMISDAKVWDGLIYFWICVSAIGQTLDLISYDGSTFTKVGTIGTDGTFVAGCLEPEGDRLWFTWRDDESNFGAFMSFYDGTTFNNTAWGPTDTSEPVAPDMVAF